MRRTYLGATYRKGRPLAAYHYYLPRRDGDISSPSRFDLLELDRLLERLG